MLHCLWVLVLTIGLSLSGCDGSSTEGGNSGEAMDADRVATFGIRALIQANLQNRDRSFLDYQRVERSDDGWRVILSDGVPYLKVKQHGDELVLVGTGGLGPAAGYRQRLIGYREPADPESPGFEFYDLELTRASVLEASFFFRGPIPSSYQAECRVEVVDEEQKVIYEGSEFSPPVPTNENARGGGFYSQPVPEDVDEGRPRISCETQ